MYARVILHAFLRQRRHKALLLLAVASGTAAMTAMLTLRVNLADDLAAELRRVGANMVIRPAADSLPLTLHGVDLRPAGAGALLEESALPRIETIFWTNNIVAFAPMLDVPVTLRGVPRHFVATVSSTADPYARFHANELTLEGTYFAHAVTAPGGGRTVVTGVRRLNPAWRVAGAWPRDGRSEALAGIRLARRLRLVPGDVLQLAPSTGPGVPVRLRVTGVLTSGSAEDGELIAPLSVAQSLAGEPGKLRRVLVSAITKPDDAFARRDPATMTPDEAERWICSPYARSIAAQLRQALPGSAVTILRPVVESEGAILTELRHLIWLMVFLALIASALASGAAMSAAVGERRGEIALMKALGAQDAVIVALFIGDALLVAALGGVVGLGVGQWMALRAALHITGHPLAWKPALVPVVLLLAAAAVLAGSLPPLRRAMRLDPAPLLQEER